MQGVRAAVGLMPVLGPERRDGAADPDRAVAGSAVPSARLSCGRGAPAAGQGLDPGLYAMALRGRVMHLRHGGCDDAEIVLRAHRRHLRPQNA